MRKHFINNEKLFKQKRIYTFLILFSLIAIISGILFYFILSDNDKNNSKELINNFFTEIKTTKNMNYFKALINSILNTLTLNLIIWILGISVIGFPIIILIYFTKCFIIGFSISSIIASYGFKGILKAILYIFPHQLIGILNFMLITFYALSFCIKLFNHLFLKKQINFKEAMNRYFKILIITSLINIVLSIYEIYISTYLIRLVG